VRDAWFKADREGDFYGQCYELCGKEHAYMPIHVKVLSQQAYSAWVGERQKEMAAKADDPNKVWDLAGLQARASRSTPPTVRCHQPNGKGGNGVKPLDASPVVLDADKTKQIHTVLEGANKGAMPAWKQLSDTEIAAVITFTKNHWSNATGQLVQPTEVAAARK
jgi:cytochrome c oxidase subunit 2